MHGQKKKSYVDHKQFNNKINTKIKPKIVTNYDDYEDVYVTTGDLGCSNVVPRYDYTIDTKLVVTNRGIYDMVLKLVNTDDNIASRMVYISKNSTYTISNIPQGIYFIKEAHGDKWKQKTIDGKCVGIFTENASYHQSQNRPNFFISKRIEGNYEVTEIPSYSLELGITFSESKGKNYIKNNISSSEFNE